jgi:penicillin-binding protein 2
MIGAIANGGHFYRPFLLKQTRNRETGAVKTFASDQKRIVKLDADALELVRSGLIGVVNEPGGTAHGAQTPMAIVAGKTGTAQVIAQKIPGRKLSESTRDHAWFISYAPADNPKIAVAVLVEHGGHGGSAAAPVARKVIEEYLKNVQRKMVR